MRVQAEQKIDRFICSGLKYDISREDIEDLIDLKVACKKGEGVIVKDVVFYLSTPSGSDLFCRSNPFLADLTKGIKGAPGNGKVPLHCNRGEHRIDSKSSFDVPVAAKVSRGA